MNYILKEGFSPILFHWTSLTNVVKILSQDTIKLTATVGNDADSLNVSKNKFYYFSMARSMQSSYLRNKEWGAVLKLDGRKLGNRYSGKSVDYWNDRNHDEMEDRLYHDKPKIKNAKKYIKSIYIYLPSKKENRLNSTEKLMLKKTKGLSDKEIDELEGSIIIDKSAINPELKGYIKYLIKASEKNNFEIYAFLDNKDLMNQNLKKAYDLSKINLDDAEEYNEYLEQTKRYFDDKLGMFLDIAEKKVDWELLNDKERDFVRRIRFYPNDVYSTISADIHNNKKGSPNLYRLIEYMQKNNYKSFKGLYKMVIEKWKSHLNKKFNENKEQKVRRLIREVISDELTRETETKRKGRAKQVQSKYVKTKFRKGNKRIKTLFFKSKHPQGSGNTHIQRIEIPDYRKISRLHKGSTLQERIELATEAGDINVHCSCLTGDTLIPSLNGKTYRIDEFDKGEEIWIYSSNKDGKFIPKKAKALGQTGTSKILLEIKLDNGEIIKCTPNHKFMLRDGTFREAQNLKENDSLMPLYRKINEKGYEEFKDNVDNKWKKTHTRVNRCEPSSSIEFYNKIEWLNETKKRRKKQKCLVTHHKDFNKINNSPENLQWMGCHEHWLYHSKLTNPDIFKNLWKDPEWRKMKTESNRENGRLNNIKTNPFISASVAKGYREWYERNGSEFYSEFFSNPSEETRKKLAERGEEMMKKLWSNEEWVEWKRRHQSKNMKEYWKTSSEEMKMQLSNQFKIAWEDPEIRKEISKKISNSTKKLWENGVLNENTWKYANKMFIEKLNTNSTFKNKISENNKKASNKHWNSKSGKKLREERKTIESKRKVALGKLFNLFKIIESDGLDLTEDNYDKYNSNKRYMKINKWFNSFEDAIKEYRTYNHKIKSIDIIKLDKSIPVYDLYVEDTHNFLLDVGVFVHNCNDFLYKGYEWMADAGDYGIEKQNIPPEKRNPELEGSLCKHLQSVMENLNKFYPKMVKDFKKYAKKVKQGKR